MKDANMVAKKKCVTPYFLEQSIIANPVLGLLIIFVPQPSTAV